eukprot:371768_1
MNTADSSKIDAESIHHFHIRYFSQLVLYQILTLLQVILIVSTICKFHQNETIIQQMKEDKQRIYTKMKQLFIAVLTMGSLVFFLVEWYGIADFLYDFAALPQYCDIAAILGNLSLMTYLLTLYLFYLYRLWATFHGSAFRLSSRTITTLLIITFATYFIMVTLVFVLPKGAVKHTPFSWTLDPSKYKPIIICEGEFSIGIDPVLRIVLQCIVIVGNTFYGWIFYKKLYDLLKFMEDVNANDHKEQKETIFHISDAHEVRVINAELVSERAVYQIMIKQTTLVALSTISTSILWSITNVLHYFNSYWQVLIYLDITINCLCLFLMFSWNDALYKMLCKPCAKTTDFCCSKLFKSAQLQNIRRSLSRPDVTKTDGHKRYSVALHFHAYHESEQFKKSKASSALSMAETVSETQTLQSEANQSSQSNDYKD